MGGRGASSGRSKPSANYEPYKRGQITKYEAGAIYRASKEGKINVKPEMTKMLYAEVDANIRFALERYQRDGIFYDRIYDATRNILDGNYKKAQKELNAVEEQQIKYAGKKSIWYKYKK